MLGRRASAEATAASRAATAANQSNADSVRAQNAFNTLLSSARTDLTKRAKPGGALYKKYKDNPDQLEMDAQEIARTSMFPELMSKLDIPKLKMPADLGPKTGRTPPAPAIADLKKNNTPQTRAQFDAIFGAGAAQRALGK
jgi:hypothetical protein